MPRFNSRLTSVALLIAGLSPLLAAATSPPRPKLRSQAVTPEVSVVTVVPKPHAMVRELPGRIAPLRALPRCAHASPALSPSACSSRAARSRPAISLYQIDPKPFEVELQAAEASLAKANAVFEQASHHARRIAQLTARHATSEAENEKAIANMRQAEADVAGRKADFARARLNLDYTTIRRTDRWRGRRGSGDRGRARRPERDGQSRDGAATRHDLRRLHPVGDASSIICAAHSRAANWSASHRARRKSASCWTMERSIRCLENSCFPKPRSMPRPAR